MQRRLVVAVAVAVALAMPIVVCAGCPVEDPCAEKVLYTGGATDEVLLTMNDAKDRAEAGNANGPTITAPTDGQELPAADTPTFTWDSPLKTAMALPVPARAPHTKAPPSIFDRLSTAVIPKAYAHEPPVSSDVYLVEVPVDGQQCGVTIVTTDLSVQPNADQWVELKGAAGKDLTMSVTSAYLQQGRIQEGPYKAAPITFQVKP